MKTFLAASAALLTTIAAPAQAAVTFQLDDVTFADGATATGTFTTDDAVTMITDWSITTAKSTKTAFVQHDYRPANGTYALLVDATVERTTIPRALLMFYQPGSILYVGIDKTLTAKGANIVTAIENETVSNLSRQTTRDTGSISALDTAPAVPEPATWAMLLVGFGMIGGAARYRRRGTRVRFA